jgi:photosystem II stability/assembly factor-like uncharacterized protein
MPYTLTVLPGQPGTLLVGLRGGTVLLSDDAGDSWTNLGPQLDDIISLQASPA